MTNNILTKDYLEQKYIVERLSIRKIAKLVGCGKATIRRNLIKYNIPIKTNSEAKKGQIPWNKGKHLSEEHIRNLSKSHEGIKLSEEHKRKISESMNGKVGSNKGKFGEKSSHWKGGRIKSSWGYIFVYAPEHSYGNSWGYIFEHRLVVEKYLGRCLLPGEVTHHIDGIKDDNRPENLIAFISQSAHLRFHKDPNLVRPEEIIFDGRLLR